MKNRDPERWTKPKSPIHRIQADWIKLEVSRVLCRNSRLLFGDLIINWSIIMRFYCSSTQEEADGAGSQNTRGHPPSSPLNPALSSDSLPVYFYYFNNYCNQFLYLSNQLNQELALNNNLINLRVAAAPAESSQLEQLKMDVQVKTTHSNKNTSQNQEPPNEPASFRELERPQKMTKPKPKKKKLAQSDEEDSYKPEDEDSREMNPSHVSESKNIPKNYGKAVLNFIHRSNDYVVAVLQHLGLDYGGFMESLHQLRGNVNTIMQLRSLWLQEQNPFAKAYRIFTMEYLRKHSLSYIFNSRVENFHKHIKYRYKMVESVSDPRNFTHMKEF